MSDIDLREVHDLLVRLARRAGETITAAQPTWTGSASKKNSADVVTETDRAVEAMLSRELREHYPTFEFMGEETYQTGDTLTDTPTFVVDPIDGTLNFVHGLQSSCVSLGLTVARRPVVGVVLNPFTDTLYTAIRGQGAFVTCGGGGADSDASATRARLPLRSPPEPLRSLSHCLVAVEWGSERTGNDFAVKTATFAALARPAGEGGAMVQGLHSLGSAALNLCAVAAGQLDVYWEAGCWAWDVCAGWAILAEAGGRVVGAHPGDWEARVEQRRYLAVRAGDAEGQRRVIEEFWGCVQGRVEVGFDGSDAAGG